MTVPDAPLTPAWPRSVAASALRLGADRVCWRASGHAWTGAVLATAWADQAAATAFADRWAARIGYGVIVRRIAARLWSASVPVALGPAQPVYARLKGRGNTPQRLWERVTC